MLAQNRDIPVFAITNNVVDDLATFTDAERKQKTLDGVMKFIASNRCDICRGTRIAKVSRGVARDAFKRASLANAKAEFDVPVLKTQFVACMHLEREPKP
jgi:hypothetical protein